jgi:ribosomal protein L21E
MPEKAQQEYEVGDLFVTETALTLKLLPSRKTGTVSIRWFAKNGGVINVRAAAKDIQVLVGKIQGRKLMVRGLVVTTDQGRDTDLVRTRLSEAVTKAGFKVIA